MLNDLMSLEASDVFISTQTQARSGRIPFLEFEAVVLKFDSVWIIRLSLTSAWGLSSFGEGASYNSVYDEDSRSSLQRESKVKLKCCIYRDTEIWNQYESQRERNMGLLMVLPLGFPSFGVPFLVVVSAPGFHEILTYVI